MAVNCGSCSEPLEEVVGGNPQWCRDCILIHHLCPGCNVLWATDDLPELILVARYCWRAFKTLPDPRLDQEIRRCDCGEEFGVGLVPCPGTPFNQISGVHQ